MCNQRHKHNLFPLQNPHKRALNHKQKLNQEQPLFIDPGKEDPEEFIAFRGNIAVAIDDNPRGQATISALRLNIRDGLQEDRLQRLQMLRGLWCVIQAAENHPENIPLQYQADRARNSLAQFTQDNQAFASAARSAIKTNFQYVLA
jgi:hypothetical protein